MLPPLDLPLDPAGEGALCGTGWAVEVEFDVSRAGPLDGAGLGALDDVSEEVTNAGVGGEFAGGAAVEFASVFESDF